MLTKRELEQKKVKGEEVKTTPLSALLNKLKRSKEVGKTKKRELKRSS